MIPSFPATESASPAFWSWPRGSAYNGSWHQKLLEHEDNLYDWSDCEGSCWREVPVTLLICLCGLVGNGAVLWLLSPRAHRNPNTIYVLSLAVAHFTFLLSIAAALVIFYGPESLCRRLGSQHVTTALNITIVFAFTASVYLLTALSAAASLSILPPSRCPCRRSPTSPVLVCAFLWALSFLLTLTLYFCPAALTAFLLSYVLSVLTLFFSGLALLARVLCCSWRRPPRELCVAVLLPVIIFPFLTVHFGYWLLLRLFDFSVFAFDTSLPLACANSGVNPLIYFLAGSCCAKKFTLSLRVAFQRAFEDVTEPQNRGKSPRENTVQTAV